MPKKTFEGEGNPSTVTALAGEKFDAGIPDLKIAEPVKFKGTPVIVTDEERKVLKVLLDRDRTARQVHGGLKSLLTLSDDDVRTLLTFLERV